MTTNTHTDTKDANATNGSRYRYVEYTDDGNTVSIIQDAENHRAWIQSTVSAPLER